MTIIKLVSDRTFVLNDYFLNLTYSSQRDRKNFTLTSIINSNKMICAKQKWDKKLAELIEIREQQLKIIDLNLNILKNKRKLQKS